MDLPVPRLGKEFSPSSASASPNPGTGQALGERSFSTGSCLVTLPFAHPRVPRVAPCTHHNCGVSGKARTWHQPGLAVVPTLLGETAGTGHSPRTEHRPLVTPSPRPGARLVSRQPSCTVRGAEPQQRPGARAAFSATPIAFPGAQPALGGQDTSRGAPGRGSPGCEYSRGREDRPSRLAAAARRVKSGRRAAVPLPCPVRCPALIALAASSETPGAVPSVGR